MPTVDFRLCLVTDRMQTRGRPLVSVVHDAGQAGLPAVQIRERDLSARLLLELVTDIQRGHSGRRPRVIVNDRLDIALASEADGVHLRADSRLPVAVVRGLVGPRMLVGVSTHSLEEVRRAGAEGADYVVLGPIYETPSKRSYGPPVGLTLLEQAAKVSPLPIFAIGGMTPARVAEVRRAGAYGVAVMSAILTADDVARETETFLHALHGVK